jgi:hypothetical protein
MVRFYQFYNKSISPETHQLAIQTCIVFNDNAGLSLHLMKKWFAFILLLITTAGTFVPCCEADGCCADQAANSASHNNHETEGTCSPFFACATCPGFVELSKPIQLTAPIVEKTVQHQSIVKFTLPAYFNSFWQPPRYC